MPRPQIEYFVRSIHCAHNCQFWEAKIDQRCPAVNFALSEEALQRSNHVKAEQAEILHSRARFHNLCGSLGFMATPCPKPPISGGEVSQRSSKFRLPKLRPVPIAEVQLCKCELPQQKITQPPLPGRPVVLWHVTSRVLCYVDNARPRSQGRTFLSRSSLDTLIRTLLHFLGGGPLLKQR
jgi:hypothetical protein